MLTLEPAPNPHPITQSTTITMATSTIRTGGISLLSILGFAFVFCKLAQVTDVANWSWIAVTAPFWIPLGLILGVFLIMGAILAVVAGLAGIARLFRGTSSKNKWERKVAELGPAQKPGAHF